MLGRIWASLFTLPVNQLTPLPQSELYELTQAIKNNDINQVDIIVQNAKENNYDLNTYTKFNFTPLHYALTRSRRGKNEEEIMAIITLLNDGGADINKLSGDKLKTSPLHTACRRGMPEFVQWLLDRGADKEQLDQTGQTPLDYLNKLIEQNSDTHLEQIHDMLVQHPRPGMHGMDLD